MKFFIYEVVTKKNFKPFMRHFLSLNYSLKTQLSFFGVIKLINELQRAEQKRNDPENDNLMYQNQK